MSTPSVFSEQWAPVGPATGSVLSPAERERYRRQMMLEGFGSAAQERLKSATVFVAGVGGLGGTTALYLTVAGVGRIVLAHYGNLTLSNMNRQVLMRHDRIGTNRNACAAATLSAINPDVRFVTVSERIDDLNAPGMIHGADIAVGTRPNFPERRALNRACVAAGIPLVEAAMDGMEAYLTTMVPGETPCLDCLYPEDPPWEELGFPVLGGVSGAVGCLAALEVVKYLTGYGTTLRNRKLHFDTKDMRFRTFRLRRDPRCPTCGGP